MNYSGKNLQIQFLRGIGCLSVLLFHYLYRYNEIYRDINNSSIFIKKLGVIGVYIFLIIMGYYLVPKDKNTNPKKYVSSRLSKLYPPYLLCITITYLFSKFLYLGGGREVSLFEYIQNIFLINGFIFTDYVDGAHWYITYVIVFILIMDILLFYNLYNNYLTYYVWVILSVIANFLDSHYNNILTAELSLILGGAYTSYVIIGITLRNIADSKFSIKNNLLILFLCSLSILIINGKFSLIISIILSILIFLCSNRKIKVIEYFIPIIFLGDISYVVYLIHQNIGFMLLNNICEKGNINQMLAIILVSSIVIILSLIINSLINNLSKRIKLFLE